MATILTAQAQDGWDHLPDGNVKANPWIYSSPCFYAFEAGRRMWVMGMTRPTKATMGRGDSVNLWTAANRFKATFPGDDLGREVLVERLST